MGQTLGFNRYDRPENHHQLMLHGVATATIVVTAVFDDCTTKFLPPAAIFGKKSLIKAHLATPIMSTLLDGSCCDVAEAVSMSITSVLLAVIMAPITLLALLTGPPCNVIHQQSPQYSVDGISCNDRLMRSWCLLHSRFDTCFCYIAVEINNIVSSTSVSSVHSCLCPSHLCTVMF